MLFLGIALMMIGVISREKHTHNTAIKLQCTERRDKIGVNNYQLQLPVIANDNAETYTNWMLTKWMTPDPPWQYGVILVRRTVPD